MLRTICLLAVVLLGWTAAPAAQAHEGRPHAAPAQQAQHAAVKGSVFFVAAALADRGAADICKRGCCTLMACASCCAVIAAMDDSVPRAHAFSFAAATAPSHLGRGLPPATPPPRA
jgi:hypothetical protein